MKTIVAIWPTVSQQERFRIFGFALNVLKVDLNAIDFRSVLRIFVEFRFLLAPIVRIDPVVNQVFQISLTGPKVPTRAFCLTRPTGVF
ncbi:hypothetical protein D3C86_1622470 [compost metagenome]